MKRLLRAVPCLLLCLILLAGTASADTGPKPAVTITVINAPEEVYYLDLLQQDEDGSPNIDREDYDPALLEGLERWEDEGWYPALVHGTDPPMFGDLVPGEGGTHHFTYFGLPETFRIAVSSASGAQATAEPFTRTVFYTHLTYDWESNTITAAPPLRAFMPFSSCPPWFLLLWWKASCCGCSDSAPNGTGWCSFWSTWPPRRGFTCGSGRIWSASAPIRCTTWSW